MGLQQSKEELLYEQVGYGNTEGIKALHLEGAGLEWRDGQRMTPLIVASMDPQLYHVAETLIELGADIDVYRSGRHAGTPLHHAVKRGLDQTVKLLLSYGANALVKNDNHQSPLDVARKKGYTTVVRTIESHICLFSGWLREFYGPRFLEVLAPQCSSRKMQYHQMVRPKRTTQCTRLPPRWGLRVRCTQPCPHFCREAVFMNRTRDHQVTSEQPLLLHQGLPSTNCWVVVMPCSSRNHEKPLKLVLAIYTTLQDAQPRKSIALWKSHIEEPKLLDADPVLTIFHKTTETLYKLASANEGDKQQLQWLYNACRGMSQEAHPPLPPNISTPVVPLTAVSTEEDVDLAMAISASIVSTVEERPSFIHDSNPTQQKISAVARSHDIPETASHDHGNPADRPTHNGLGSVQGCASSLTESTNGFLDKIAEDVFNGWGVSQAGSSSNSAQNSIPVVPINNESPEIASISSAPPVPDGEDYGPILYPTIDPTPVDMSMVDNKATTNELEKDVETSSCVICLDAPTEGVCIPCGHMAGCMSCLNGIKAKNWGCPVCRANINQVIRVYSV